MLPTARLRRPLRLAVSSTEDAGAAMPTARAIRGGRFWVGTCRGPSMSVPFDGFKSSGCGWESGLDAIRQVTETAGTIMGPSGQPVADPFIMRRISNL